jgi:uncharacterized repeat protein (TIGR01451 family)
VRQFVKILAVLGLAGFTLLAMAQTNTAGGTTISNTATATFTDSGGVTRNSTSNTVTTTVQTVYAFNIEPDTAPTQLNPSTTPTFVNPTSNNNTAAAGATTTFNYTIVNNTNNGTGDTLPVTLTAFQDPTNSASGTDDNFDLSNVIITVYNFTDTSGDGLWTPGTDTLGTVVATGTAGSTLTFNFPALSQGTRYAVIVTGVLPSDTAVNGNQASRLDLRATNDDAVTAGFNTTTAANANLSFENQNFAKVSVQERNVLGVAKNLQSVVNNGNGTYDVTYVMTLENFGNVTLSNVQVLDNLTTTFSGATYSVQSLSATGTLSANSTTNFTGGASPNNQLLVAGSSTLARQAAATVTLVVRVTPGSNLGPYNNQVTASGSSPLGVTVNDTSSNGLDPDVDNVASDGTTVDNGTGTNDNNNVPTDNTSLTPVTFTEVRGLGVAKSATAPTVVSPGVFETTFTFTLRNLSNATNGTELRNVQVVDNLAQTFPAPATFTVQSRSATGLTVNNSFNGNGDQNLLAAGQILARNTTATVTVVVRFDPNGLAGPFINQATATGTTPQGTTLTDLSDDGTNPDQDGDGKGNEQAVAYDLNRNGTVEDLTPGAPTPDEGLVTDVGGAGTNLNSNGNGTTTSENDPTPITISNAGVLGVAKRVISVTPLTGANLGQFDVVFELNLENHGNVNLTNVQVVDAVQTSIGVTATLVSIPVAPVVSNVTAGSSLTANPTSPVTASSPFNGNGKNNLLSTSASNLLRPGAVGRITFTARIDPNGVASLTNTATASGTTPSGAAVSDTSTDGADPDGATNNNDPSDSSTPTPITIPETPELGVAMAAGTPSNNGDGTYTVVYTVTVENLGNVDLTNVQVALPFITGTTPFTAAQVTSATITATTGGLTANSSGPTPYNGEGNNNLLSGTNGLAVGASGTITVSMVFTPGTALGSAAAPYQNNAVATATSPAGPANNVTDTSENGNDSDTDTPGTGPANNLEANDDSIPTPVFFTESPRVGLAKAASVATEVTSGSPAYPTGEFTTTFTFTFENHGNIVLTNLQAADNLNTTFGAGNYTVTARGGTGVNTAFNGDTNQNLLLAGQTLAVGATRSVTVTVRFNPNSAASGTITNTATATATGPGGTSTSDISTDGTDPDGTTNNNDPSDSGLTTPVTFTERPVIAVAKVATLLNADVDSNPVTAGPYSVRFDYTLRNLGNVTLTNLSLTENFVAQLGGAANFTITSSPAVGITTTPTSPSVISRNNPAFNGNSTTDMLLPSSTLTVGQTAVLTVTVTVNTPGAYTNQVTATASGPAGRGTTTDTSDSGTNPDANGNGNPNEPGDNDPTPVNLDALLLAKTQRVCDDANCVGEAATTVSSNLSVKPGEYIEYTIVGTNAGGQNISNVEIRDAIPVPTQMAFSSRTIAGIECTTDPTGASGYAAANCPSSGTSTTVKYVRLSAASVTASGNTTLRFVVFVP